jgi:hypothetical protein
LGGRTAREHLREGRFQTPGGVGAALLSVELCFFAQRLRPAHRERLLGCRASPGEPGSRAGRIEVQHRAAAGHRFVLTRWRSCHGSTTRPRMDEYRNDLDALRNVLLATPSGAQIPLGEVAKVELSPGPSMIRDEDARLTATLTLISLPATTDRTSPGLSGSSIRSSACLADTL